MAWHAPLPPLPRRGRRQDGGFRLVFTSSWSCSHLGSMPCLAGAATVVDLGSPGVATGLLEAWDNMRPVPYLYMELSDTLVGLLTHVLI